MVLQPSYIDVTQMEDSCLNLKDLHTSLRKNSLQKESGYVNTTQSFGGKFQSSLEECSGVKSYDNEKFQSTLEGCAKMDKYETPVTNQVKDSDCKIVGNKLLSLLNEESHHSKWEEFRRMAKQDIATEECSSLLRKMELEVSEEEVEASDTEHMDEGEELSSLQEEGLLQT